MGCKCVVKSGPAEGDAHSLVRAARCHADRLGDRGERLIDVGNHLQRGRKRLKQMVPQMGVEVIRKATAQLGLDFNVGLARRAAEEAIEYLFDRDRIAVTRQDIRMNAARNHFAVDQHAIAVENDEIEWLAQDLSSSSGTQYNSSR